MSGKGDLDGADGDKLEVNGFSTTIKETVEGMLPNGTRLLGQHQTNLMWQCCFEDIARMDLELINRTVSLVKRK